MHCDHCVSKLYYATWKTPWNQKWLLKEDDTYQRLVYDDDDGYILGENTHSMKKHRIFISH
jgi:hypothetical protein